MRDMMTTARQAAAALCVAALLVPAALANRRESEVPAGTRFLVELRDKLEARKVKPGKKFEARTLEPLQSNDGNYIPAGTKVKGRVNYARDNQMQLQFEEIQAPGGKRPLVATVTGVIGDKNVKAKTGEEGEIQSESHRGRNAAIGAVVLGGVGAAVGATQAGAKGAAIGAGAGAATGAVIGAASGGPKNLVLYNGTRIELALDRPLYFKGRR